MLIEQPAIKQENGDFACVTTSRRVFTNKDASLCVTEIPNVNPHVPDYWSTYGGARHATISKVVTYATSRKQEVVLSHPFVYQPDWTVTSDEYPARISTQSGLSGPHIHDKPRVWPVHHGKDFSGYGYEDYGYIPQALVDYLSRDSGLSSRFFQSMSLFPGGPQIELENPCVSYAVSPWFAEAADEISDSSEETINVAGCFNPGACPAANGPAAVVTTTPVSEPVPQSASVPAPINRLPPATKTQAATIQRSRTGLASVTPSSDIGAAKFTPQESPLQSSLIEQSNDGTPGRQLPPQPHHAPIATTQKFNGATPNQQSSSQPGPDPDPASSTRSSVDDTSDRQFSLHSSPRFKAPTQNFDGETFDQQPAPQPGSNSAFPPQNPNGGTEEQVASLQSNSKFITSAQNFNGATFDQQFPSQSDSNLQNLNGGEQRQDPSSQPKPGLILITMVYISSQFLRPAPSGFKGSSPQAPNTLTTAAVPVAPKPAEAPKPAVAPVITIGPSILTADSKQRFIIDSQSLAPGSSAIVAFGSTFSLLPSASALVVNGITSPLTAAQSLPALGKIIAEVFYGLRPEPEQNQRATTTWSLNAAQSSPELGRVIAEVFNGLRPDLEQNQRATTPLPLTAAQSLPAIGKIIAEVFNGLRPEPKQNQRATITSVFTVDNQALAVDSVSFITVQGDTLAAGGTSIVAAGATFTLAPFGLAILNDGVTTAGPASDAVPSSAPILTDNGRIIIADASGQPSFGVQVLSLDGGSIAVSGIAGQDEATIVNGMIVSLQVLGSGDIMTASLVHATPELVIGDQSGVTGRVPLTISRVPVSIVLFGNKIIAASRTEEVPSGPTPVLIIAAQIVTATKKNANTLNDQRSTSGAVATVSGIPITLDPNRGTITTEKTSIDSFNTGTTRRPEAGLYTGGGTILQTPMTLVVIGSILMSSWIMVL